MTAPRHSSDRFLSMLRSSSAISWTLVVALCVMTGCRQDDSVDPSETSSSGVTEDPIVVQLNWYPEAEHGGVYQALADGTYDHAGLTVEIRPGGRATPVAPELELGRADFGFANADDVVAYRREGLDIVAVLAAMQNSPRCILVRNDSGVTSLDDLAGMTLQAQAGRPFLKFMQARGILDGVQQVPYFGSVSSLVNDPKIAIQAYSFAEPLLAEQQGVEVTCLMVSDLGWNPYSSVLITTGTLIKNQPERVKQFVQATQQGWRNYLTDPSLGNRAILAANEHGMTAEALQYGSEQLRSLALPDGMSIQEVGKMSLQRWQTLVQQMDEFEPGTAQKVRAEDCFTNAFLN